MEPAENKGTYRKQRDRPFSKRRWPPNSPPLHSPLRQPRLKALPDLPVAYYHCVSRVVNRDFVLGDAERELFVKLLRLCEQFCGVRVVTHCVMSNHFHILVEVPKRSEVLPPMRNCSPASSALTADLDWQRSGHSLRRCARWPRRRIRRRFARGFFGLVPKLAKDVKDGVR